MDKRKMKPAPFGAELVALAGRAQQGDATAVVALRETFQDPGVVELVGNLAKMAQETLVTKMCGQDLLIKEGLTLKLESLRIELEGANPSALERLLVERVVACWLHLNHLETTYAGRQSQSLALGVYYQRSLSAAQKRYLAAIRTLALVRRLAIPVLQVNIARKQVNVAGTCVGTDSLGKAPKDE